MRLVRSGRVAFGLVSILAAAACSSGYPHSVRLLGDRLETRLAPQLTTGQARLDRLPDGASVTLSDQLLFAPGSAELSGDGRYVLASTIEGLIEPRLLQIILAEPPGTPLDLQQARVRNVAEFLADFRLPPLVQPAVVEAGAPQAVGIIIRVNRNWRS